MSAGLLWIVLSSLFWSGSNRLEIWRFSEGPLWILERARVDGLSGPWSFSLEWAYDRSDTNATFDTKNRLYRYHLSYSSSSVEFTVGTFETTLGRGFLLYSGEDEVALLDRFLVGTSLELWAPRVRTLAFVGRPESYLFYERTNPEDDWLFGGEVEWTPSPAPTRVGLEAMGWATRHPLTQDYVHTTFFGGFLELQRGKMYLYTEGAFRKGYDPQLFSDTLGWAGYLHLGYQLARTSLHVEWTHLTLFGHPYMLPPALDHYGVYLTGGRKESGVAIEWNGRTTQGWVWTLHASRLWGTFFQDPSEIVEVFGKLQKRVGPVEVSASLDGVRFVNAVAAGIFDRTEWTPVLHAVGTLSRQWGWDVKYQPRKRRSQDKTYTDHDLTLGLSRFPWMDLAWTLQKRVGDSTGTWTRLDLFLHLGNRTEIEVTLGSQRKDLVCSGGVCRFEPEFRGVRGKLLVRF